jgi:hypothetical protein
MIAAQGHVHSLARAVQQFALPSFHERNLGVPHFVRALPTTAPPAARDVLVLRVKTGHGGGAEAGALNSVIAMEQVSAGGS